MKEFDNENCKKINIDIHFFILFFISCSVFISDIFIYTLKTGFIQTNFVVIAILAVLSIILIKKKIVEIKNDFSKFDLFFIMFFLIYFVATVVFPDLSWDTRSYHIYLQENVFADKINEDFFAGRNLNSYLFALGDRINYFFRYLLGYRLGTIFSYYLIIVLFYQVKKFIKYYLKDNTILNLKCKCNKKEIIRIKENDKSSEIFVSLFSIFPTMLSVVFAYSGTYYIDNFGLVFLMEVFYNILCNKDILKNRIIIYFTAMIVGLSISIKVTNAIFLIPIFVYFCIKERKNFKYMKIYDYLIVIFLMSVPWLVYFVDSYIQTGNPVFPYYNQIFKSKYFMESSWQDDRFGPKNVVQFLIWPIYIIFYPKRAFDTRFVDIAWLIGYVSEVIYLLYFIFRKKYKSNSLFTLDMILLTCTILWEKMIIGYVRYASIIVVLGTIFFIANAYKIFNKNKCAGKILFIVFIIIMLPSIGYDLAVKVKDFSSISDYFDEYFSSIKMIALDRKNEKIKVDGNFGSIGDDSMLPTLLRDEENYIYNLEEWVTATNKETEKLYKNKIYNKLFYVLVDENTVSLKEEYLKNNNFDIISIEKLEGNFSFLSKSDTLYLYKVKKNAD